MKVALVTGANKGIGYETARRLAQEGITVLLGARDSERGTAAAARLQREGLDVRFCALDVSSEADRQSVADYIEREFGRLDILINNAGVSYEFPVHTGEPKLQILRRTFEVNFFAVVALTETLLPLLKKSDAARIVNVSSILGSLTIQSDPTSDTYEAKAFGYNASKTALNAYTVNLAWELRHTRIKVNSAHPGWVKTDMGSDAAPLSVEEGAETSVWLALLGEDGPTGGFFFKQERLAW